MKTYEMIHYLKDESSQIKTLEFIKSHPECHEVLRYLGDFNIRTGLASISWGDVEEETTDKEIDADIITKKMIEYFSKCGPDGSRIDKIDKSKKAFLSGPRNQKWKWFVELIATHGNSSRFGVGLPTLEKAGITFDYKIGCQLGVSLDSVDDEYIQNGTWRITEKVDGVRRLFLKRNGEVEVYSRSGKVDNSLGHIVKYFESNFFADNCMYDCELVDREMYDRQRKESIDSYEMRAKTAGQASRKTGDKTNLVAVCFDFLDFNEAGKSTLHRTKDLQEMFEHLNNNSSVRLVEIFGLMQGYDKKMIDDIMQKVTSRGGEGLMLQEIKNQYKYERTKDLIKVKRLEEFKGIIEEICQGKKGTRLEKTMAQIICRVKDCDSKVSVGTGFSDDDRKIFWENRDELIGAKIEIEAFSKTVDKNGQSSLCFPVFKVCLHELFNEEN